MSFVSFMVYVFVTSFTPGPNNIMALAFGNQYGWKKTLRFCFGVGSGFAIISIFSIYFNLLLKNILPKIEWILMLLGVVYMLYLAYKMIKQTKSTEKEEKESKYNRFLLGMILQFINPKGILYGLTVVSIFILPNYSSHIDYLLFSLSLGGVGVLSTLSWSIFGAVFQQMIGRYEKLFNRMMALLLVYCAISIVI